MIKYIDYQKDQTDIKYFHGIPYIKRPDKNRHVIGQTTLKKTKDKEKDIIVCDDIFYKYHKVVLGYKKGYIPVNNNEYIVLKRRFPILIIIIIMLLSITTVIALFSSIDERKNLKINNTGKDQTTEIIQKRSSTDMRIIISSAISCDGKNMLNMGIKNLNKNRYLRYIFEYNEDIVYDSQLVEYNRTIQTDQLNKNLEKGNYFIKVKIESYDLNQKLMGYHYAEIKLIVE